MKERRILRQKSGCLNHSNEQNFQVNIQMQTPGKGVHMYRGVLVSCADLSQISHENEMIWSH